MRNDMELPEFRVYGKYEEDGAEICFDEYCYATTAQSAANRVREWYSDKTNCAVLEVSKVMKGWK